MYEHMRDCANAGDRATDLARETELGDCVGVVAGAVGVRRMPGRGTCELVQTVCRAFVVLMYVRMSEGQAGDRTEACLCYLQKMVWIDVL